MILPQTLHPAATVSPSLTITSTTRPVISGAICTSTVSTVPEALSLPLAGSFWRRYSQTATAAAAMTSTMMTAPLDPGFETLLFAKIATEYADYERIRFRSSTNAEDLEGFTGAGLYVSDGADPTKPNSIRDAIRTVYGSVWFFRAFEERSYRNIDHKAVGMALLVHHSFPAEEASGVAITANIYDKTGMDPGFTINVQYGDNSVVLPDANVTTDEFIYKFGLEGQPIIFMGHSNMLPAGQTTVLTTAQVYTLGIALQEIHEFFQPLYGRDPTKPYAMDTEFKFDQPVDDPTGKLVLSMKQCRPYYSSE